MRKTEYLILFLLLLKHQQSLTTGEGGVEDFRGSHDFQGERRGNQSSPTEVKGEEGTVQTDRQF